MLVSGLSVAQTLLEQQQLHTGHQLYLSDPSIGQVRETSTYTPMVGTSNVDAASVVLDAAAYEEFATSSLLASLGGQTQVQY